MSLELKDDYKIIKKNDDEYYVLLKEKQEVNTWTVISPHSIRLKMKDGRYKIISTPSSIAFISEDGHLQTFELIDNLSFNPPSIKCRNSIVNIEIFEDYATYKDPNEKFICIEKEKWHLLADVKNDNNFVLQTPESKKISYIPSEQNGYILYRELIYKDGSIIRLSYEVNPRLLDRRFFDNQTEHPDLMLQTLQITNNNDKTLNLKFVMDLQFPYEQITLASSDTNEKTTITTSETKEEITDIKDYFFIKSNEGYIRAIFDIIKLKKHISKIELQKIDVDTAQLKLLSNILTINSGDTITFTF